MVYASKTLCARAMSVTSTGRYTDGQHKSSVADFLTTSERNETNPGSIGRFSMKAFERCKNFDHPFSMCRAIVDAVLDFEDVFNLSVCNSFRGGWSESIRWVAERPEWSALDFTDIREHESVVRFWHRRRPYFELVPAVTKLQLHVECLVKSSLKCSKRAKFCSISLPDIMSSYVV